MLGGHDFSRAVSRLKHCGFSLCGSLHLALSQLESHSELL